MTALSAAPSRKPLSFAARSLGVPPRAQSLVAHHGYPRRRCRVFHTWNLSALPPSTHPLASVSRSRQSTGPSPSDAPFEQPRRRCSRQRSGAFCSDSVQEYRAPIRLLAPHRLNFAGAYIHTYRKTDLLGPPADDTRPPWVTHIPSPPCRPRTAWCAGVEPCAFAPIVRGATIPRLRPTGSSSGSLPSITTRRFSASPPDPASRRASCPPEFPMSVAPGRPIRVPACAVVPQ